MISSNHKKAMYNTDSTRNPN